MSALWEIQKAIFTKIEANATLMSLISSRVYDEVEVNSAFPYICVANPTEITDNTLSHLGYDSTFTLYIYTKPGTLGWYPAYAIYHELNKEFNGKRLSFNTSSNLHNLICKADNLLSEKDGENRILHARYRFKTESTVVHTV